MIGRQLFTYLSVKCLMFHTLNPERFDIVINAFENNDDEGM